MCDCVPSALQSYCGIRIQKSGFTRLGWRPRNETIRKIDTPNCSTLSIVPNSYSKGVRNAGLQFSGTGFDPNEDLITAKRSKDCVKVGRNPAVLGSEHYEFNSELGFKENGEKRFGFQTSQNDAMKEDSESRGVNFLELKGGLEGKKRRKSEGSLKGDDDLIQTEGSECIDSKSSVQLSGRRGFRSARQVMRRSSMLAKQVISMQSALSLGFISQLWVDTSSWAVSVVEVKPNLLSGESERFLLEDVCQVGDVVLIHDESVMEHEFKMVGLETLVGCNVVTPGRRNIGKVRGYTFNINSGAIESLELDSFGISIIPSSLVSTYALLVEDVLEVVSDTVVVHEAAASHLQRLTKGFLKTQNVGTSIDDVGEYSVCERQPVQSDRGRSVQRNFRNQKYHPKMGETKDDWELPMDYL